MYEVYKKKDLRREQVLDILMKGVRNDDKNMEDKRIGHRR